MPFPGKPGSLLLLSTHRRESGSTASASPARALPRPPSGRVGPAPALPAPAEPSWALTSPAPPCRAQARVGGVSAAQAPPAPHSRGPRLRRGSSVPFSPSSADAAARLRRVAEASAGSAGRFLTPSCTSWKCGA